MQPIIYYLIYDILREAHEDPNGLVYGAPTGLAPRPHQEEDQEVDQHWKIWLVYKRIRFDHAERRIASSIGAQLAGVVPKRNRRKVHRGNSRLLRTFLHIRLSELQLLSLIRPKMLLRMYRRKKKRGKPPLKRMKLYNRQARRRGCKPLGKQMKQRGWRRPGPNKHKQKQKQKKTAQTVLLVPMTTERTRWRLTKVARVSACLKSYASANLC